MSDPNIVTGTGLTPAEQIVAGIFAVGRTTAQMPVDAALELLMALPEAQAVEAQQAELAKLRAELGELRKDRAWEHDEMVRALAAAAALRARVTVQDARWAQAEDVLREFAAPNKTIQWTEHWQQWACSICHKRADTLAQMLHAPTCATRVVPALLGEGGQ